MTEFRANVVLDAQKATASAIAFGKAVRKTSTVLEDFQQKTLAVTQGGSANVFRKYENSVGKLDVKLRNAVVGLHSMKKGVTDAGRELAKLEAKTDKLAGTESKRASNLRETLALQRQALPLMVSLNKKYDENARVVAKAKRIRNELNLVVASGLKTKKAALIILKKEMDALRKSTKAYKDAEKARKASDAAKKKSAKEIEIAFRKVNAQRQKEATKLDSLQAKYSKEYAAKKKIAAVERELGFLYSKGKITSAQRITLLKKETAAIHLSRKAQEKRNRAYNFFSVVARRVSIASRTLLVGYLAVAAVKGWVNIAKTAESLDLMRQKLELFTGDSGAFEKFYTMAQTVGLRLEAASKIITRFAVVTNRAFSIETLNEWAATLTKSARATGTSTQEMTGALIQITQAMSAGRLMGDEYRSVTENLPLFTVALREVFKNTGLSLKELSSLGLITNDRLIDGFGRLKDIIAEIPGTIGTVEARLSILANSWDRFIATFADTKRVKDYLENSAGLLDLLTSLMKDDPFEEQAAKRIRTLKGMGAAINEFNKTGKITRYRDEDKKRFLRVDSDNVENRIAEYEKLHAAYVKFVDQMGKTDKEFKESQLKAESDATALAEKKMEKLEERQREIASLSGNKKIADLKRILKLRFDSIDSLADRREEAGTNTAEWIKSDIELKLAHEQKFLKDSTDISIKLIHKNVKFQKRKFDNNAQELLDEKVYAGTVVSIRQKLAKDLNKIDVEILTGKSENRFGQAVGIVGGKSEAQGEAEKALLIQKAEAGVALALKKTRAELAKLTAGGRGTTEYEKYLERVNNANVRQENALVKVKKEFRDVGNSVGELGETYDQATDRVNKFYDRQRAVIKDDLAKKYEVLNSKRLVAIRREGVATDGLAEAQKLLVLSSEELTYRQRQIQVQFLNTTESALATIKAYSALEGAQAGVLRGLRDYEQKAGSVYDTIAKHTKGLLDITEEAFGKMYTDGSDAFSNLKDKFKDLVDSMITELIKLAARPFIIQLGASVAGLLGFGKDAIAGAVGTGGLFGAAGAGFSIKDMISSGSGLLGASKMLTSASASLNTGADHIANALFSSGFDTAGNLVMDSSMGFASAGGGSAALGAAYSAGAGIAGGMAGTAIGEALFGRTATSSIGATVGGFGGALVGSVTPLGPVIGAALGSAIGGALDALFGKSNKKKWVTIGVVTNPNARDDDIVSRAVGGSGLEFAGRSKRAGDEGKEVATAMTTAFAQLDTSLTNLYGILGTDVDLKGATLPGFFGSKERAMVDQSDLADAADNLITAWVKAVNERTGVIVDLEPIKALQSAEESLSGVINRIQLEFVAVTGVLEKLDLTLLDLNVSGLVAADGLTKAFDGLQNLGVATSYYYENFYTDQEKANNLVEQYTKDIQEFNATFGTAVNNKTSLRGFVDSLDLMTTSGQTAFVAALKLSSSVVGLEDTMSSLTGVIGDTATEATKNLEDATNDLMEAYKIEIDAKQDYIDKFLEVGRSLKAASQDLLLSDLSPLTNRERLGVAKNSFEETFAKAMEGDEEALKSLNSVSEEYLKESRVFYASSAQYTSIFNGVRQALDAAGISAIDLASTEEQSLVVLQNQYDAFLTANDLLAEISEKLTLQQALDAFETAKAAIPMSNEEFLNQLYTVGFGREADNSGLEYWMSELARGFSRENVLSSFIGSSEAATSGFNSDNIRLFAEGGTHRGGLRVVGENGPELEYTSPSYITSSRATSNLLDNRNVEVAIERMALRVVQAVNTNTDVTGMSANAISNEVKASAEAARSAAWREETRNNVL